MTHPVLTLVGRDRGRARDKARAWTLHPDRLIDSGSSIDSRKRRGFPTAEPRPHRNGSVAL